MEKNMNNFLVYQTDFGTADGAVSAMYGVALQVEPTLRIFDLTHDIPRYNIWEASYRLVQTVQYWPAGTVFVSVVDPGVGTNRLSVAVKTKQGHIIVTPDNGTLTHVNLLYGIEEARVLNESENRLSGSELSYTFHGRDVYAYTGARLAAHKVNFSEIGPEINPKQLVSLDLIPAYEDENKNIHGTIDVLDVRFGSLWSNIPYTLFKNLNIDYGKKLAVSIRNDRRQVYANTMVYARSFADVSMGEPLVYINSLLNVAIAINQGSFAQAYNIGCGQSWKLELAKIQTL
ncbi:SAM hydrolase/SAM-dependent halogenase family protein [Treponema phagedenis]|uniref:SAM hydrolase/SAM-dependent halogenase family protein n=2 Tax=Treponema phagedenis TaxID=162 RepID=UPI0001F63AAA|nr:S-adenosyl-l-methionine hydroxide adenosyltransferase family protein [Treponema phagedenis]EFW38887.1 hypothetical protein HMPREF9554_00606 [Treponema phagedenis F0421]TYT78756.1 S-adenosyl-l-methionine hydroxide adenosyltransferase family protein [Treponema phagedenis]